MANFLLFICRSMPSKVPMQNGTKLNPRDAPVNPTLREVS
jgi:hypothetical protein